MRCLLTLTICVIATVLYASPVHFLIISDIHLNAQTSHRMEINPKASSAKNETDKATLNLILKTIQEDIQNKKIPKPSFIINLGDVIAHKVKAHSYVKEDELTVFSALKHYFPKTPILYVFGNNDSFVQDYGPISSVYGSVLDIAKQAGWRNGFLSTGIRCSKQNQYPCLLNTNQKHGYYTAYLQPHLKLIVLNSILFSHRRNHMKRGAAQQQLLWFSHQLAAAKQANDSVIIAMHIPLGHDLFNGLAYWKPKYQHKFLSIIDRNVKLIRAILVGHTHMEEMKIIDVPGSKQKIPVIFTPAISTFHGNAASFKTFTLQQVKGQWYISNYTTYNFTSPTSIHRLYDFDSVYCKKKGVKNIAGCLKNIMLEKVQKFYSAGNQNIKNKINYPQGIWIKQ